MLHQATIHNSGYLAILLLFDVVYHSLIAHFVHFIHFIHSKISLLYFFLIDTHFYSFTRDPSSRALFAFLTERAAVPYFAILEAWVLRGEIDVERASR